MDLFNDDGLYIEIPPYEQFSGAKPADYSAKLAAAKKLLGPRYCLANPRYAVNRNKPQITTPALAKVALIARRA